MSAPPDKGPYIGRALPRFEDVRFITGTGRYTDDCHVSGEAHAVFVRSPHAHAEVASIRTQAASALPGVIAVLTGAQYIADGCGVIPHWPNPADALKHDQRAFRGHAIETQHFPMPADKVRYPGEPIAVVIAESRAIGEDAAELVEAEYRPLAPIVDIAQAVSRNELLAVEAEFGDRGAVHAALARADIILEHTFKQQRIVNAQMEPRACIAWYEPETKITHMIAGSQGALRQRDALAGALSLAPELVHVVCPDVGGGFGPRSSLSPEQAVAAWAARKIGRPVRWLSTRSEAFLTDYQGRDSIAMARLGLSRDGIITAYDVELLANIGAYSVSYVPPSNFYRVMPTVYDIPAAHIHIKGLLTNTIPTGPYRGAGRPEATYVIERLLDIAASRLGTDRVELRKRNIVRRDRLPYRSAMGLTYDSGDFLGNLRQALERAEWAGFAERKAKASRNGMLAGIGVSNYVESPVGAPHERVDLRVDSSGFVEVIVGTQSSGQGHETSFAQVLADHLQVAPDQIRLMTGDTRLVSSGGGTHSDRSMRLAGSLLVESSGKVIQQAKPVAAHLLGASTDQIAYEDGVFGAASSNRKFSLFDIARAIDRDPNLPGVLRAPLAATARFTGRLPAFPTGTAVCEVEIDPETGVARIVRYTCVDDAGQPINPLILEGQVHGGIVQGVGQALLECAVSDNKSGQMLTGSFLDYALPRADNIPGFNVHTTEDPTSGNILRVKGAGESGITPALAAVMNAICDALAPLGIEHIELPATPAHIWQAILDAKGK